MPPHCLLFSEDGRAVGVLTKTPSFLHLRDGPLIAESLRLRLGGCWLSYREGS